MMAGGLFVLPVGHTGWLVQHITGPKPIAGSLRPGESPERGLDSHRELKESCEDPAFHGRRAALLQADCSGI